MGKRKFYKMNKQTPTLDSDLKYIKSIIIGKRAKKRLKYFKNEVKKTVRGIFK